MSTQQVAGFPRLSRSTRFRVGVALLLVPTLHLLLLVLALASFALAAGIGWTLYELIASGHFRRIELWLVFPALAGLLAGFYLLRGFVLSFWRPRAFEPAIGVDLLNEPDLTAFVADVCKRLGTPFPDSILLHLTGQMFVAQYRFVVLNGRANGRVLSLSLPLMACLSVDELRAVVSHEFAHFTGKDVLYSAFIQPVYSGIGHSLDKLLQHRPRGFDLAEAIAQLPLQVPVLVLKLYAGLFHRIEMSTSRDREHRADAVSAAVCGTRTASNGMRKVYGYGAAFDELLPALIDEIRKSGKPDESCYRLFRKRLKAFTPTAQACVQQALEEPEDPWMSHPTLMSRLERLPQFPDRYNDPRPAMALLRGYKGYEKLAGLFMAEQFEFLRQFERLH